MGEPLLHPNQFQLNEAWIAFQLNDAPIETEQDGSFNCIALMDAASCFILGNAMVQTDRHSATLVGCGDEAGEDRPIPLARSKFGFAGLITRNEDERGTDRNRRAVPKPGIIGRPI